MVRTAAVSPRYFEVSRLDGPLTSRAYLPATASLYHGMSGARRPGHSVKRVNVDFPVWMIASLDKEARRLGVPRQSIIKVWVAERLERAGYASS